MCFPGLTLCWLQRVAAGGRKKPDQLSARPQKVFLSFWTQGEGKGVQVGAAQKHGTLEFDLERSPPKPPGRILRGVRGARTDEISTKSLRGRDPTEEESV